METTLLAGLVDPTMVPLQMMPGGPELIIVALILILLFGVAVVLVALLALYLLVWRDDEE